MEFLVEVFKEIFLGVRNSTSKYMYKANNVLKSCERNFLITNIIIKLLHFHYKIFIDISFGGS